MPIKYKAAIAARIAADPWGFLNEVEQATTQEVQDMLDAWHTATLDPETMRARAEEIRTLALGLNMVDVVASAEAFVAALPTQLDGQAEVTQ